MDPRVREDDEVRALAGLILRWDLVLGADWANADLWLGDATAVFAGKNGSPLSRG